MSDPRLAFRILMAALLAAVSATVIWLAPDIPGQIISLWGAVFMGGVGAAEVLFDRGTTAVPNNASPTEVEKILEPKRPVEMLENANPAGKPPEPVG